MKKVILLLAVVLMLSSTALAGSLIGPVRGTLGAGQWAVDLEYFYQELDLKYCGKSWEYGEGVYCDSGTIQDASFNMWFGSLEYGVCDNWDVFVRLGVTDLEDDVRSCDYDANDSPFKLNGDYGFAAGVGFRNTICQTGDIVWGSLIQATYLDPDGGRNDTISWDAEMWEFQAVLAANMQLRDDLWLYLGPMLHCVCGEMDLECSTGYYTGDMNIRQESCLGAVIGGQWYLPDTAGIYLYGECQIFEDGWGGGLGCVIPVP